MYDVEFHGILALSAERPTPVQVKLEGRQWSVASATSTDYAAVWPIQVSTMVTLDKLQNSSLMTRSTTACTLQAIFLLIPSKTEPTRVWTLTHCGAG